MLPIAGVTYTTPDGIERSLRFTLGARKRIAERFGQPDLKKIFAKYGDGALPEIAYSLMYDSKGKPPAGLEVEELAESLEGEDAVALLAAVMSAASKGAVPKNELEALLREQAKKEIEQSTGSDSGVSPGSASESQPVNSGISQNVNSTLSQSGTTTTSVPETSEAA